MVGDAQTPGAGASERTTLRPEVVAVSKDLVLGEDGILRMAAEAQQQWLRKLQETPAADREAVGEHLAALAWRLAEEGGEPTRPAVEVLLALAAVLLGSIDAARRAMDERGGMTGEHAKATGAQTSNRPTPSGSGLSVFGLMVGRNKK